MTNYEKLMENKAELALMLIQFVKFDKRGGESIYRCPDLTVGTLDEAVEHVLEWLDKEAE